MDNVSFDRAIHHGGICYSQHIRVNCGGPACDIHCTTDVGNVLYLLEAYELMSADMVHNNTWPQCGHAHRRYRPVRLQRYAQGLQHL